MRQHTSKKHALLFLFLATSVFHTAIAETAEDEVLAFLENTTGSQVITGSENAISVIPRRLEKPNIIYIMLDDTDIQDLKAFGASDTYTPQLDALAQNGMIFTNFYAAGAVCSPSRAAVLTSRFPLELGFTRAVTEASPLIPNVNQSIHFKGGIPKEVPTIAEVLSPTYQTAHFGKWHVGLWQEEFAPPAKGFEQSHVIKGTYFQVVDLVNNQNVINRGGYRPTVMTDLMLDYIDNRNTAKPFFINAWYLVPHTPLHVPPGYVNTQNFDLATPRGKMAAMLHHLDGQVKRIVDKLEELNLADNTLIMITSDNGGLITPTKRVERLYNGYKHSLFDGGLRVPLIAYLPGKIPANSVNESITSHLDIFPTLLDFAGLQNSERMAGNSMYDTLINGQPFNEHDLLWARTDIWRPGVLDESSYTSYAYRSGNFKLIKPARHVRADLYDIAADPYESTRVRFNYPQTFRKLENAFEDTKTTLTRIPDLQAQSIFGNVVDNGNDTYSFTGSGNAVYLGPTAYTEFSGTSGTIDFDLTISALPETSLPARIMLKHGSYDFLLTSSGILWVFLHGYDADGGEDSPARKTTILRTPVLEVGNKYNITLTKLFHKKHYNSYRLYLDHALVDEKRDNESLYSMGTRSFNYIVLGSSGGAGAFSGDVSIPRIYNTFFNTLEISRL